MDFKVETTNKGYVIEPKNPVAAKAMKKYLGTDKPATISAANLARFGVCIQEQRLFNLQVPTEAKILMAPVPKPSPKKEESTWVSTFNRVKSKLRPRNGK